MQPLQPAEISTDRLRLEPLRENHAPEMVRVLADVELYDFTGGTAPTLDQLTLRYRSMTAGPADGSQVWCNWILRDVGTGRAAGFVQATITGVEADVAWLVGREFQGQGRGVEAAIAMVGWLGSVGVATFVAYVHPRHIASQRIAKTLGMTRSGEVDSDGEETWSTAPR